MNRSEAIRADVAHLLEQTDLPGSIRDRIIGTVDGARLGAIEGVDVARELIAHFEDGLDAGHDADDLLGAFGDDTVAAQMIERIKRAARARSDAEERLGSRGDSIVFVLLRDLRYGARRLAQSPGFTLTAIVSLALGIGANTAIFSIVNSLLLTDLPYEDSDALVNVYEYMPEFPNSVLSYPDYRDLRDGTRDVFSDVSAMTVKPLAIDTDSGIERRLGELVSGNYFSILGLHAAAGRLLGPEDDIAPGTHPVVVLSHGYWQRQYDGDPGVVGKSVRINGAPYTIVGVAPESHKGTIRGLEPDIYAPIMMAQAIEGSSTDRLEERAMYAIFPRARLRPGVTLEQARQATSVVEQELRQIYPDIWNDEDKFVLIPTRDVVVFPMFDGAVKAGAWLLLAVVGLVLLIACANLASFLLARAVDRRKEIAIRLALGATRGKLIGQLLVETALLALLGGAAGVGLAFWMLASLGSAPLPFPIPMAFDFAIDGTVLAFSLAVSLLAGLLFGLAPALQATRPDMVSTLRDETAGAGGGGRLSLRNTLVVGQVAVSVVLLVSAGLFLRSLQGVYATDPGFGREPSAILSFSIPVSRYNAEEGLALLGSLRQRLSALPGVEAVGAISNLHLNQVNTFFLDVIIDGVPPPPGRDAHRVDWATADAPFLEAAGISLLRGRNFDPSDTADGAQVIIISEAFAQRFWSGEAAIGRTVRTPEGAELTVVGIASDTKVRSLGESPRPFLYRPMSQNYEQGVTFVARTSRDPKATALAMLRTLRTLAPDLVVWETKTMEDHLAVVRSPARLLAIAFGVFAALAIGLVAIGLYGLVSYTQSQRVREVGIRMSLGADARSVVALLIASGMKLVAIGGIVGLVGAFGASRLLSGLLYGVEATDPLTFVGVVVLLVSIALPAAWIPARRASRINPVEALRSE